MQDTYLSMTTEAGDTIIAPQQLVTFVIKKACAESAPREVWAIVAGTDERVVLKQGSKIHVRSAADKNGFDAVRDVEGFLAPPLAKADA